MSVAELDKSYELRDVLGSLGSFTVEGPDYWQPGTGNGAVSSTLLYGATLSRRSRWRRARKEQGIQ